MLHVRQTFERIGRSSPVSDPALTQAARMLAREALVGTADAASGTRDRPRGLRGRRMGPQSPAGAHPELAHRHHAQGVPPADRFRRRGRLARLGSRWWRTTTTPCSRCSSPTGRPWSSRSRAGWRRRRRATGSASSSGRRSAAPRCSSPGPRAGWTGCRTSPGATEATARRSPSRSTAATPWRCSGRGPRDPRSRRCSRWRWGPWSRPLLRRPCSEVPSPPRPRRHGRGSWPG